MDCAYLFATDFLCVLECEAEDALRGFAGDELDGLYDAVDDDVFNARIFAFGVFADEDRVDIVVWCLVASNRLARTKVGK